MLVSVYEIDSLFNQEFKKIISIYEFANIRRYIVYKKYLFLCMLSSTEDGVNITISSDYCIFYNGDYFTLNKKELKKILDAKIREE